MENFPLKNWIPYKLVNKEEQLQCHWLYTFSEPFNEPFFDDSIGKLKVIRGVHIRQKSVSSLNSFEEWAGNLEDIAPAAIIFHISRCGSTLVSQLLALSNQHIVLPEVPFFDSLLRLPYQYPEFTTNTASKLFATALKYYGQKRSGNEERVYIKTDSWHIFFYAQLRQLYPSVPFVLMYRDPNEVFNSHKKQAAMQAVPGLIEPAIFEFKAGEELLYNQNVYLATVLEKYLKKYLQIIETDNNFLLINYNEGPMPIMQKIAAFTKVPIESDLLAAMEERSRFHSKKPGDLFAEAAPVNIPAYLEPAMQLYQILEERRKRL
jgi:hypothetical protein